MNNFLNPKEILNQLELRQDMVAADFGCGSGGWVIPLAKILEKGKIYAIDILEESLSALEGRARSENIFNIERILADVEKGVKIKDNSVNLVLMTNLLFEAENKEKVLQEARRILKEDGKILVVDWKKETILGPKEDKISKEEVKELAERVGLISEKEFAAGKYHWGLILKK